MIPESELTEPELKVCQSAASGTLIDLRPGGQTSRLQAHGANCDGGGAIRAELLRDLLTGANPRSDTTAVQAVKLRGARISGGLDLEAEKLICPLLLQDCYFEHSVNLTEAQAPVVRFRGCHLPRLVAAQLETRGDLELAYGFEASSVSLRGAHIGGALILNGATLNNPGDVVLDGYGLAVDQWMSCGRGFTANGQLLLINARIGGALSFTGAELCNPDGWVLDAQGTTVSYALFLGSSLDDSGGFTAHGGIRLVGMHVNGFVSCWDATFNNPSGFALAALGLTVTQDLLFERGFMAVGEMHLTSAQIGTVLNLDGATLTNADGAALTGERISVGQAILCREGFTAHGKINLTSARIDAALDFTGAVLSQEESVLTLAHLRTPSLILRPATAPKEVDLRHANIGRLADDEATWPTVLRLQDFTYETLDEQPALAIRKRLNWLRRDPDGYLPHSYEQLADAYRRSGREEAARQTAIAKQWRRRTVLNAANKLWNWVLYLTVGYGYRTWQAGLWLLALLIVGTHMFDHAHPAHMVAIKQPAPSFNGVAYAADILIPIINLGVQDAWQPRGAVLYWSWILAGAGWVLTTAVVAGLTGILKRN